MYVKFQTQIYISLHPYSLTTKTNSALQAERRCKGLIFCCGAWKRLSRTFNLRVLSQPNVTAQPAQSGSVPCSPPNICQTPALQACSVGSRSAELARAICSVRCSLEPLPFFQKRSSKTHPEFSNALSACCDVIMHDVIRTGNWDLFFRK